jgi:hypothetical protein
MLVSLSFVSSFSPTLIVRSELIPVLFMVFFSFGWTPLQALYPAEVLSYENRAKGLGVQSLFTNAVSCINTFGMPPALRAIGYISESCLVQGKKTTAE